jgi:glucan 1,3-beta-glucosidase
MFESKPGWVVDEWTYGEYMATQNNTMGEITAHWNSWFEYGEASTLYACRLDVSTGATALMTVWSIIPLENGEPYLVGKRCTIGSSSKQAHTTI